MGSELVAINIATPDARSFALKNVLVTPEIPAKNIKQLIDVKEYSYLCNLPLPQLGSDAQADRFGQCISSETYCMRCKHYWVGH